MSDIKGCEFCESTLEPDKYVCSFCEYAELGQQPGPVFKVNNE